MKLIESALIDPNQRIESEALRIAGYFPRDVSAAAKARIDELAKIPKGQDEQVSQLANSALMLQVQLNAVAQMKNPAAQSAK